MPLPKLNCQHPRLACNAGNCHAGAAVVEAAPPFRPGPRVAAGYFVHALAILIAIAGCSVRVPDISEFWQLDTQSPLISAATEGVTAMDADILDQVADEAAGELVDTELGNPDLDSGEVTVGDATGSDLPIGDAADAPALDVATDEIGAIDDGQDVLPAADSSATDALGADGGQEETAVADPGVDAAAEVLDGDVDAPPLDNSETLPDVEVANPPCPTACDDKNLCTIDKCSQDGACVSLPAAATCDDGNPCTLGDQCKAAKCSPGPLQDCDDKDPCTSNFCDAALGCVAKFNTAECNDGDPCLVGDTCTQGSCKGSPKNCGDGNSCTLDTCADGSCSSIPANGPCSDGSACSINDLCIGGVCTAGLTDSCDDANDCTQDGCNAGIGCIHNAKPAAAPCNDGSSCTTGDQCSGGMCKGVTSFACSDGNDCTTDSCDNKGGCLHISTSAPCDDGDPCSTGDTCAGGACKGKTGGLDGDNDGYIAAQCGGPDCNDTDKTIFPGATDLCDGKQNDCLVKQPFEPCDDLDGDGFCATGAQVYGGGAICPKGGGDCSDDNPYVYPGALVPCLSLVSPAGVAGAGPCAMIANAQGLHMAWRGSAFDDLRYRRINGATPEVEIVVDRSLGLGPPSIAIRADGSVVIAYVRGATGEAWLAYQFGNGFKRRALGPAKVGPVAVAVDKAGQVHVLYTAKDSMVKHVVVANYAIGATYNLAAVEVPSTRSMTIGSDGLPKAFLRGTNSTVHVYSFAADGSFVDTPVNAFADPTGGGALIAGPDGKLHLCFKSLDNHRLVWASNLSGTWITAMPPTEGDYGDDCAISVDPGGAIQMVSENAGTNDLQAYAVAGGKWTSSTVVGSGPTGACDMVRDKSDVLHFGVSGSRLATLAPAGWKLDALEAALPCAGPADLRLDNNGKRHLVNWTWPETCYGTDSSGKWTYAKVSANGASAATSRPRVLINSKGEPIIGFTAYQGSDTVLYLASLSAGLWQAKVITSWVGSGDGYGYPGVRMANAESGNPGILYLPQNSSTYHFAQLMGGSWQSAVTSASGMSQANSDNVAYDWVGRPHVLYCSSWGEVRYATATAGSWSTTTVDNNGCQWVAMTATSEGEVTAIYSTGKSIRYARFDGQFWVIGDKNAPALPLFGNAASMVGSYPGFIRLVYRTDVATYFAQGKLGQPFVSAAVMPPTCQIPTLQVGTDAKLVIGCDGRMLGAVP